MKNKKRLTYLLLALVIGIWGYLIGSVFLNFNENNVPPLSSQTTHQQEENLSYYAWHDSLSYDTLERDPFMLAAAPLADEGNPLPEQSPPYAEDEAAIDPMAYAPAMDMQYLGYIENNKHAARLALVQINGKQQYLHVGQQSEGITILQIGAETLKIKTDYQILTLTKQ